MFAWTFGKWSHAMSEIYWVSDEGVIQPEARGSHGAVVDIEFGKCVEVDSACLKTGCHWEIWELMFQSAFVTPSTSVQIVQRLKSMETCKRFIYCFGECACVCACVHKMAVPYRTYLYKPYEIFFVVVEPICVTRLLCDMSMGKRCVSIIVLAYERCDCKLVSNVQLSINMPSGNKPCLGPVLTKLCDSAYILRVCEFELEFE